MPQNPTPLDYFRLYFTDRVLDLIVTETNRYAEQYIQQEGDNLRRYSIIHQWVPTHKDEICALLGLLALMGIVYKPRIAMYWSNDELYNTPVFRNIMTRDRFLLLIKFLHFADNTNYDANDPNRDRLYKIREFCQLINDTCGAVYYPCEDFSVDESLVLFKGRLFFRQYIKTKRSRFGIKLYELCTYHGIVLGFIVYHGDIEGGLINPQGGGWLQTERILLTLLEPYLDRGHSVLGQLLHKS